MRSFEFTLSPSRTPDDALLCTQARRHLALPASVRMVVCSPAAGLFPECCPDLSSADYVCVPVRRSLDARGTPVYRYRIEVYASSEHWQPYRLPEYPYVRDAAEVIVVGAGPAGLFAALKSVELGLKPIVLERGKDVHERKKDMAALSRDGVLDPDSNYCYGEGGAGAFSDGKLFTRSSKRGDNREVLFSLVRFGADPSILIDAHPHIGTDRLPSIVENIRNFIISRGGEYHFSSRVAGLSRLADGTLEVQVENAGAPSDAASASSAASALSALSIDAGAPSAHRTYRAKSVILATGHSARDVYEMLAAQSCRLEAKGFAMGVRVEHPQAVIDRARYHSGCDFRSAASGRFPSAESRAASGRSPSAESRAASGRSPSAESRAAVSSSSARDASLPPAEYSFVQQVDGRGVFSFCMCPGGVLVPSSTEPGTVVLNGMSNSRRNSRRANAGVVVSIEPEDVPEKYAAQGPFGLLDYQRDVERSMSAAAHSRSDAPIHPFAAPAQRMTDFCRGRISADLPETTYRPGVVSAPLHEILPPAVARRLQKAFPLVDRTIRGYYTREALLLGVESRTSSPVRICRDPETLECEGYPGLYPCGEGAGYSGGIVSSAIDGIRCAVAAAEKAR